MAGQDSIVGAPTYLSNGSLYGSVHSLHNAKSDMLALVPTNNPLASRHVDVDVHVLLLLSNPESSISLYNSMYADQIRVMPGMFNIPCEHLGSRSYAQTEEL